MKIWIEPRNFYARATPMDDKARLWLREQFPIDVHQYYGDSLAIPLTAVEGLENKFVDAGGQLI